MVQLAWRQQMHNCIPVGITFEFDQGHVTKTQPITVLVLFGCQTRLQFCIIPYFTMHAVATLFQLSKTRSVCTRIAINKTTTVWLRKYMAFEPKTALSLQNYLGFFWRNQQYRLVCFVS